MHEKHSLPYCCCFFSVDRVESLLVEEIFVNQKFIIMVHFHEYIKFKQGFFVVFLTFENMLIEDIRGCSTFGIRDVVVRSVPQNISLPNLSTFANRLWQVIRD